MKILIIGLCLVLLIQPYKLFAQYDLTEEYEKIHLQRQPPDKIIEPLISYLQGRCRRHGFSNVEIVKGVMNEPMLPVRCWFRLY